MNSPLYAKACLPWEDLSKITGRDLLSSLPQLVCTTSLSILYKDANLSTECTDQIGAAIEGFIWPKVFWDFMTLNLNGAVNPVPVLQILNLLLGLLGLAWEWPLKYVAGSLAHRSIEFRLIFYPLSALLSMLLYQGTDPALYYVIGIGVYFWAYSEGEVRIQRSNFPKYN